MIKKLENKIHKLTKDQEKDGSKIGSDENGGSKKETPETKNVP